MNACDDAQHFGEDQVLTATQSASWSNAAYPLVAILDAAGYELMGATEGQREEHVACYGGAGRMPTLTAETPAPEHIVGTTGLRREGRENDGTLLIHAERWRQIEAEGWTPEHDDHHTERELSRAARCYLGWTHAGSPVPSDWPWEDAWWKPSDDPIRNLERAGALIAAEIDRLQRLTQRRTDPPRDTDRDDANTEHPGSSQGGSDG